MVKFQLEAVAVCGGVAGNGGQAGVSLGTDTHTIKGRTIDLYIALVVFLSRGVFQHGVPVCVIHQDVDADDAVRVKERRFVFHGNAGISGSRFDLPGKCDCAKA